MKIREVIDNIDKNYLFIPAFQREYVWKKVDAKNLIASLIKGYPTGTLLTWETTKPPELKGNYVYKPSKGKVKIILDGQQRITTLYMLLTKKIPPFYTEDDVKNKIWDLFIDIETLDLEYYTKIRMQNEPRWVSLSDIFLGNIMAYKVAEAIKSKSTESGKEMSDQQIKKIHEHFNLLQMIPQIEIGEQIVPSTATTKEAIDIFYIVNASGVNLTDAELALAQISDYWPDARQQFKDKLQQLESQGWVFKLDFIVFVLLAVLHGGGSRMEKLHTADNKAKIKKAWALLDKSILDYTFNMLQSHVYIDHTNEINSIYAIVPIIAYIYSKKDHKLNEREIATMTKWFYYSQIKNRYNSQVPQKLDKDLKIIANSSSPFDDLLDAIAEERALNIKPSDFEGKDIRHPLFGLMRWFFKSQGAVCFGTGNKIRKNMGAKYQLERDHIFAYSTLRDSGKYNMDKRLDYALAQEMANRVILTTIENGNKSAKNTYEYLSKVKENFPSALRLQCVPEDEKLWHLENYEDFLEARRNMLADKLNEFLSHISMGRTDHKKSEIDVRDLIDGGERDFIEFKSTMRWDTKLSEKSKHLETIILRTVAAFSNKEGGTLFIGVADDGSILGLVNDYNTLSKPNKDGFELYVRTLIDNAFGQLFSTEKIHIDFPEIDELEICRIEIEAGTKPLFLETMDKQGQKQKKFYVRTGNSSREMAIDNAAEYIKNRF